MGRICVCGAFRLLDVPKGGQEVKTCILADALETKYGKIYRNAISTIMGNDNVHGCCHIACPQWFGGIVKAVIKVEQTISSSTSLFCNRWMATRFVT